MYTGPTQGKNNVEHMLLALHKSPRGFPPFAVTDLFSLSPRE